MTSDETIRKVARVLFLSDRGDTLPAGFAERQWDEGHAVKDDYIRRARALADEGLIAPAPHPAPWWRVIGPDGGVWCETSSESEARQKSRPGDTLQQLWETPPVSQWITEREADR